jgi:hypothetical protein
MSIVVIMSCRSMCWSTACNMHVCMGYTGSLLSKILEDTVWAKYMHMIFSKIDASIIRKLITGLL